MCPTGATMTDLARPAAWRRTRDAWLVEDPAEVRAWTVSGDLHSGDPGAALASRLAPGPGRDVVAAVDDFYSWWPVVQDAPDHGETRALVLTTLADANRRPAGEWESLVESRLASLTPGPQDLIASFVTPLLADVAGGLLGAGEEASRRIVSACTTLGSFLFGRATNRVTGREYAALHRALAELRSLIPEVGSAGVTGLTELRDVPWPAARTAAVLAQIVTGVTMPLQTAVADDLVGRLGVSHAGQAPSPFRVLARRVRATGPALPDEARAGDTVLLSTEGDPALRYGHGPHRCAGARLAEAVTEAAGRGAAAWAERHRLYVMSVTYRRSVDVHEVLRLDIS